MLYDEFFNIYDYQRENVKTLNIGNIFPVYKFLLSESLAMQNRPPR